MTVALTTTRLLETERSRKAKMFGRERVFIYHDAQTGLNPRNCHVILRTPDLVALAIDELQNSTLFDRKV